MSDHPQPSAHARELVRGAYDVHIHVAPDVMRRRIDDVTLAERFAAVGMAGFVLKSHYVPTAERAEVVRRAHPGVDALGAITLNASVGGLNPIAVEIAGRGGARFVWLPTVDSANQRSCLAGERARERTDDTAPARSAGRASARPSVEPEGATPPMWARLQADLAAAGMAADPVDVLDAGGKVLERTRQVLRLIAEHDMTLATGHLHQDESTAVIDAALDEGVRRIVVTHPEFTSQRIGVRRQRALAEKGVLLERCYTTPFTRKVSWDVWLGNIRDVGPRHSVISSDLGQPFNPPVEDGLALAADRLLAAGFTDDDVRLMTVHNSRLLAGADPLPDAPGDRS